MAGSILFDGELAFVRSSSAAPGFGARFDHTRAVLGENELRLLACDRSGRVLGTIVVWIDDNDATGVYCVYPDGFAVVLVTPDGEVLTDATLPRQVVVERADLIISCLEPYEPDEAGQLGEAAADREPDGQWTCSLGVIVSACKCLPETQPAWKTRGWS